MDWPKISIVIPTLNSGRVLDECLAKIITQNYPQRNLELIIVDGGSSDQTLEIARKYRVDRILPNSLRTAEAAKTIGIDASRHELIALIDSDNILEESDWLQKMVAPFRDPEIFAAEPLYWTYRKEDHFINRYCALTGINDPICLFLGNYHRWSFLTDKWTELPVREVDRGEYLDVTLNEGISPTVGANGFFLRKSVLSKIDYHPYYFDIDVFQQLIKVGYRKIARPKVGIIHLYCKSVRQFRLKQRRRIYDYLFFRKKKLRTYNYPLNSFGFIRYLIYTCLVFPLFFQSTKGFLKKADVAWFFHPLACWITLWEYGWCTLKSALKTSIHTRDGWKQ